MTGRSRKPSHEPREPRVSWKWTPGSPRFVLIEGAEGYANAKTRRATRPWLLLDTHEMRVIAESNPPRTKRHLEKLAEKLNAAS